MTEANRSEDEKNIKVLRMHAGICSKAVKVEIEGPALKEQAKIFNGAADTIERLRSALKDLIRAYVSTLEAGRDRITSLGGQCDSVEVMERGCNGTDCGCMGKPIEPCWCDECWEEWDESRGELI